MKNFIKPTLQGIRNYLTRSVQNELVDMKHIMIDNYIKEHLYDNPKYSIPKKLNAYEYQIYSQSGEDGIIREIFSRIGTSNKYFVEFGIDDKVECNSLLLLLNDWKGCWIDGNIENVRSIKKKFRFLIDEKRLSLKSAFIAAENIEGIFHSLSVPKEFDLLSVDIDGNDYWVWNAIKDYSPRVVIIEYNAMFMPPIEFIVKYEADKFFQSTSHFGASLKSMAILGSMKGYKLVGCNFVGTNAFFVRDDLVKDKFLEPFTAEIHHEPPRYYLIRQLGHNRDFGEFERTRTTNKI